MTTALIAAAGGIGDLIRMTPLVTVCCALGHEVDMLIAPDYADAYALLREARDVRRIFRDRSPWTGAGTVDRSGLDGASYDVVIVSALAASCRPRVRSSRWLDFDRSRWLRDGDSACVAAIARQLGWEAPLPPPFVIPSARVFGLPPGTVALHPGCKANWPWKKWHGFDELAARLPRVIVVGGDSDRVHEGTYFRRPFAWPSHVRDLTGLVDLPGTAAVLSRCAALVANDSGLMHLGVALGIPTFGIFGITSPAREAMDAPNMTVVTKGLPCEPACRQAAWGRRDCEHHLRCLRALSADDVLGRLGIIGGTHAWTT